MAKNQKTSTETDRSEGPPMDHSGGVIEPRSSKNASDAKRKKSSK